MAGWASASSSTATSIPRSDCVSASESRPRPICGCASDGGASPMTGPAGHPVRRGLSIPSLAPRNAGSPAFAGDDDRESGVLLLTGASCRQPPSNDRASPLSGLFAYFLQCAADGL